MLAYLSVRNFALVDELELHFDRGLTVITGESGAGKSILLEALSLVLGGRASKSQIKPNSTQCEVIAEFDVSGVHSVTKFLESNGYVDADEPSNCIVRRVASTDGRSRAWINSRLVNLTALKALCSSLVEIHGQFEQQQLSQSEKQLSWFDDFVAEPTLIDAVRLSYIEWQKTKNRYDDQLIALQALEERQELLSYQVDELDELALEENEFEELNSRFKRMNRTQEIMQSLDFVFNSIDEHLSTEINRVTTELNRIDDEEENLNTGRELLESADVNIEEARNSFRQYSDRLEVDAESLDAVSSRLDHIHEIARKHRTPANALYEKGQSIRDELNKLKQIETNLEELATTTAACEEAFHLVATELSSKRKLAQPQFQEAVGDTMNAIGMDQATFALEFHEACHEKGLESLSYMIQTNPNYPAGPIKQIASGGELSRISLSIFVVVAQRSELPCLILDEADIGVGGTTADVVGRMLKNLGKHAQIVCVTHAPQVAALGDSHLKVSKSEKQTVAALTLDTEERIEEIARMVAGQQINRNSREYAQVLLRDAQ